MIELSHKTMEVIRIIIYNELGSRYIAVWVCKKIHRMQRATCNGIKNLVSGQRTNPVRGLFMTVTVAALLAAGS